MSKSASVVGICLGVVAIAVCVERASAADLAYVRLYTARIDSNVSATLDQRTQIARAKGSVEVIAYRAGGSPSEPVSRTLVRLGEPGYGYPGFTVCARKALAEAQAAGRLTAAAGGQSVTIPFERAGLGGVLEWSLPQADDAPLTVAAKVGGQELARTTIHPLAGGGGASRPSVTETVSGAKGVTIVQVFEYLDAPPALLSASAATPTARSEVNAAEAANGDADGEAQFGQVASGHVSFDGDLTGLSWSWDTKWQPGENEEPGGYPVQIRINMGVGADVFSDVEGDFLLDCAASMLQVGPGSGNLTIDFGAELHAQGAVDVGIFDPFVFDIPYVPQFDLRVYDSTTFDSFLLDSSATVSDATGRQNVVNVDIVELVLAGLIDIPGLGGGVAIDAALGASAELTADSISTTDGKFFTTEGQSLPVSINPSTGYQQTASYNEDMEMTATLTAYPVLYIEFLIWRWDLPVLELPWDVVTGQVNLSYTTSPLVPSFALTITERNGDWGEVLVDPPQADPQHVPAGLFVTLTAEPTENHSFARWEIYDPNHPGDVNYAVTDTNSSTAILMDADRQVIAVFKCGSNAGPLLPLLGIVGLGLLIRRRRQEGTRV